MAASEATSVLARTAQLAFSPCQPLSALCFADDLGVDVIGSGRLPFTNRYAPQCLCRALLFVVARINLSGQYCPS
jgi:hypothetical protein